MLNLLEPVNVWVYFKQNQVLPHIFFWRKRRLKVEKVNLVHTSRNGACIFYHFSVSSGSNFYRLRFDTTKLNWFLEAVEEE